MFQSTIGFGRRTLAKRKKTNRWTAEQRERQSKAMKAHWDAKKKRADPVLSKGTAPNYLAGAKKVEQKPDKPAGPITRLVRFFKS